MNPASASLTAPLPPGGAAGLPDFSERLSPMLVKELRQGLRSPLFVWGLISMNIFLAGVVWLTMDDPGENSLHQAFFGGYCALVCGLLPLRAAGALHDELRGNTIDTLILTKLTGWRIALGKWIAVAAQQLLATITVLPYLIVRYFVGGINVPMELAWLGIFLLAGMGSAAVLTGFSWIRYFLFRSAIMMGMTFVTGAFCVGALDEIFGYRRNYLIDELYKDGGWQLLLLLVAPALHVAFFALDLGASKVGSIVENRSLRRRVVGILFLLFYGLMAALWEPSGGRGMREAAIVLPLGFSLATLFVLGLQAILETPLNLVPVVMPMVKRGFPGRVAGRFFYPGWPSGVCWLFALLVIGGGTIGLLVFRLYEADPDRFISRHSRREAAEMITAFGATFGMLPVPLVLWQCFLRRRLPWHLGIYTLLLAVAGALALGLGVAASSTSPRLLKLGLPIPAMGLAWQQYSEERYGEYKEDRHLDWDYRQIAIFTGTSTIVWWLAAVLLAQRAFRQTREVEREAAGLLRPAVVAADQAAAVAP